MGGYKVSLSTNTEVNGTVVESFFATGYKAFSDHDYIKFDTRDGEVRIPQHNILSWYEV